MDDEKKELLAKENSKALTIEDLKEYSIALEFHDKGKKSDAKIIAKNLLKNYSEFTPALNLLKKL